jgi:hypothetical protein
MRHTARSGRRLVRLVASSWLLLVLLAAAGQAAPLPVSGELRIFLGPYGSFSDTGVGVASVQPDGSFSLPAGLFTVAGTRTLPLGGLALRASVSGALGLVSFGPGQGWAGGFGQVYAPISGDARFSLLFGGGSVLVTTFFPLALLGNGGDFRLPLGPYGISTPTGSWTTGQATRTVMVGSATTTTVFVAGFDARTPGGVGALRLVAPPTAVTYFDGTLPVYATLDLVFAPEPSSAALLAVALAAAAARRGWRSRWRTGPVRGGSPP